MSWVSHSSIWLCFLTYWQNKAMWDVNVPCRGTLNSYVVWITEFLFSNAYGVRRGQRQRQSPGVVDVCYHAFQRRTWGSKERVLKHKCIVIISTWIIPISNNTQYHGGTKWLTERIQPQLREIKQYHEKLICCWDTDSLLGLVGWISCLPFAFSSDLVVL